MAIQRSFFTSLALVIALWVPSLAAQTPPHRFLVIGSSMSDNMSGSDFESFWVRLALDVPILSDIGIGEAKPMKAFALPALIVRSNRSPGHLITDVFSDGLTRAGAPVEVEFTKQAAIDADSSVLLSWIEENLPLPAELPPGRDFEPRYDAIFALDLFYKDFKFIRDFDELEPGSAKYQRLVETKERIADILARFAYNAREVIVGSPLVAYEDLEPDPETGLLSPRMKGPEQGHEWLTRVASGTADPRYRIPDEAAGHVEVFDLRTLIYTVQRDEEIDFDVGGSSYRASVDQVLAADMRHPSKNGCKILADLIMEGIYARNPDWRPYMSSIPFDASPVEENAAAD